MDRQSDRQNGLSNKASHTVKTSAETQHYKSHKTKLPKNDVQSTDCFTKK